MEKEGNVMMAEVVPPVVCKVYVTETDEEALPLCCVCCYEQRPSLPPLEVQYHRDVMTVSRLQGNNRRQSYNHEMESVPLPEGSVVDDEAWRNLRITRPTLVRLNRGKMKDIAGEITLAIAHLEVKQRHEDEDEFVNIKYWVGHAAPTGTTPMERDEFLVIPPAYASLAQEECRANCCGLSGIPQVVVDMDAVFQGDARQARLMMHSF